jgi:hypothetical protein
MTNEAFNRGFEALAAAFPGMNFNAKLYWAMLNDLDGEFFLKAVWEFIKTTKEVFPGTNVIAIIHARATELRTDANQNKVLKLEAETEQQRIDRWSKEAAPMPEECREALKKLGIKFTTAQQG